MLEAAATLVVEGLIPLSFSLLDLVLKFKRDADVLGLGK